MDNKLNINTINVLFVKPRTIKTCEYIINDNKEIHIIETNEIKDIIRVLSPENYIKITELIDLGKSFILSVEDKTLYELEDDKNEIITKIKEKEIKDSIKKTIKAKNKENNANIDINILYEKLNNKINDMLYKYNKKY
jgi:hypothetical protein